MPSQREPTSSMAVGAEQELRGKVVAPRPLCLPEDLPASAQTMNCLGVVYVHRKTSTAAIFI